MNKPDEDKLKDLIHSIGLKYNLQDEIIKKIIYSPYKFTRKTISELEIYNGITEEEFNKLKTNFIYPYIGKIYSQFDVLNKLKKLKEARWKQKEI